jgi:hypothetical protein
VVDYTVIELDVVGWSQTISHADRKWPAHKFACSAKAHEDERLELIGAPDIRTLHFDLLLIRGEYRPDDKPLERGIGILAFADETESSAPDIPHIDAFMYGWWWLPEAHYDEVWLQVRENTWRSCSIDLNVAPVDYGGPAITWNVSNHNALFVTQAGVRFDRKPLDPAAGEPPKKRGIFT